MSEGTVDFSGTWKLEKNENWDGFASAVGMNFLARKMSARSRPTLVIEQSEDKVEIEIQTVVFTKNEVIYTGGEPYEATTMDGTVRKSVATWSEGKLTVVSEPKEASSKAPKVINVRELTPEGEMLITMTVQSEGAEDVVCKRWFKKVPKKD